jgi:S-adenosyl methyltransferase
MHHMARSFLRLSGRLSVMDSRYGKLFDDPPWHLDTSVPNVARVYDYLLGGKDNYAVDRAAAAELVRLIPDARRACHQNRQFLARAVRFLASEAGIRQFIDIGTGLPTQGSVHEVAQDITPDARVIYVDYDPVVVSHAQALLVRNRATAAVNGDLREPENILSHPAAQALIDFTEPVAILLVAVLHFLRDDDKPYEAVDTLKTAMPAGSYLVLSHVTFDNIPAEAARDVSDLYEHTTAPGTARTRPEIERFFDGMEMVEPGLVNVCNWQTWMGLPSPAIFYAGVARKGARHEPGWC